MQYLDLVLRADGAVGFVVAQHPTRRDIVCIKWEDKPDPGWVEPGCITAHWPGSGILRQKRLER